jgi:membrane dipeptidase
LPINISRRRWLGGAAALGASTVLTGPLQAKSASASTPSSAKPMIINTLGGIQNPNMPDIAGAPNRIKLDQRAFDDARKSGLTAINLTLGYVAGPSEPFEHSVSEIANWDATIRQHSKDVLKVYNSDDLLLAQQQNKIGIIYGFQNAAMLGDKLKRVKLFSDLGVRIMQLTYNRQNHLGSGCMEPLDSGLTEFGKYAIQHMNQQKVIIDLSHSGTQTCLDAISASEQAIAISHTGCRALTDLPRNKTDQELRLVAEKGGYVGIYFMPFLSTNPNATADDVVRHIVHAVNVCGSEHVGIGTDGNVTSFDDMDKYQQALKKENAVRVAAGIAAAGEGPDTLPFVTDLRGPEQFEKLASLLNKAKLTSKQIDGILGQNFYNFAKNIW